MRYLVVDNKDDVYGDFSCDGHAYEWIEYLNVRYPGGQFRIVKKGGCMTELTGKTKELELFKPAYIYKCRDCEKFDEDHRVCVETGELTIAVVQACDKFDGGFNACGFCTHWNQYHNTCTITGAWRLYSDGSCNYYELDELTKSEHERYLGKKEAANGSV